MCERAYLFVESAIVAFALVLLACIAGPGCGPTAVQSHYRAQTLVAGALTVGGEVTTDARTASLVRVEQSTAFMPVEERLAALRTERANWEPVGAALDSARAALLTWHTSTEMAEAADSDADLLGVLLRLAARVVLLYDEASRLARVLGADLPELPEFVRSLARSIGEAQ